LTKVRPDPNIQPGLVLGGKVTVGNRARTGTCHLCGAEGRLSYEHVPPRAAFNKRPLVAKAIEDILEKGTVQEASGRICQRGAGAYTLCERCNNRTGTWYGRSFAEWTHQGMYLLCAARGTPSLYYGFHIYPLRVIKQIACMFFSVNGPEFREAQPDLEQLVRVREHRHLPPDLRIYAFYSIGQHARQTGVVSRANIRDPSRTSTFSEITFPPFGYVLAFDRPPHEELLDISHFAEYEFDRSKMVCLKMPVLPVIGYMPGDYRTQEDIDRTCQENVQKAQENADGQDDRATP